MRALEKPSWIAADWGTSNLRVWAMGATGDYVDHAESNDGMASLAPGDFEPALLRLIEHWLTDQPIEVIACGMVGARQGWVEAPYRAVPCTAKTSDLIVAPTSDKRIKVHIAPGLMQSDPADVMRGEETQIAGFIAQNPDFDGIACLPGTHTKWAHISAGEIVSFRTFMSGELFALLGGQSVLKHSIASTGWDDDAFDDALSTTLSKPESLAAKLFAIRATQLLHDQSPETARARLSGLLIGAELAAAKPYWLGQNIALIGAPHLTQTYATALRLQGITPQVADVTQMTLAGLIALKDQL